MDLKELIARLHRREAVTPAMIDAIDFHAPAVSHDICHDFTTLNAIAVRHEALIRLRWTNKTVAQRRKILLAAWPDMPKDHRPEAEERWKRSPIPLDGTIPDHYVWPFSEYAAEVVFRNTLMICQSIKKISRRPRPYLSS